MLPIFYINLDKRHDRNLQLKNQLNNLKLDAQRISAIDGSKLTLLEREFVNEHNFLLTMKRPIRDGEIGCAASHRSIWQQIVDNDLNYALVLEDDAVIDKKILTLLNHSQFYQQFDLINLSSNSPYNPNDETIKTLEYLQSEYKLEDKYTMYLMVAALLEAGRYNDASIQISLIKVILNDPDADFLTAIQLIQDLKISSAKQFLIQPYLDSLIDFKLIGFDEYLESL